MSKYRMNKIAMCLLIVSLLNFIPRMCVADVDSINEKVTVAVKKGDKVPFDGVLFSLKLAAFVNNNCSPAVIKQRCDVQVSEALALAESHCKQEIDVCNNTSAINSDTCAKIIAAKDKEIDILRMKVRPPPWYESSTFHFAGGVVAGALVILGGGYALSLVSK